MTTENAQYELTVVSVSDRTKAEVLVELLSDALSAPPADDPDA